MSAYECVKHADAAAFLDRAEQWLLQNEVENNLILSIAARMKVMRTPDVYFATLEHDAEVVGCGFRTPPFKLGVTRMPAGAAKALAADVVNTFEDAPSVLGPDAVAAIVAGGIADARGLTSTVGMRQRIYELTTVKAPANPPSGQIRVARPSDMELLTDWLEKFAAETNHGPGDALTYAQSHIASKTMFVWDDEGVKTTALWAGSTRNGVRIGFVYTPPEERGKGYASACVAAASQKALESGYMFCCLFTDLGNPTSNSIYQRIGYEPVSDVVDYNVQ